MRNETTAAAPIAAWIVAASTVAIVVIAAAVIVVALLVWYVLPRGAGESVRLAANELEASPAPTRAFASGN